MDTLQVLRSPDRRDVRDVHGSSARDPDPGRVTTGRRDAPMEASVTLNPKDVSLWIVSFRRLGALGSTIRDWLNSFPFETVNVIANDRAVDYSGIEARWPQVKIWKNEFQPWQPGSIAWCWNTCMLNTFMERDWCLMSQDDVEVVPGWDHFITGEYWTYVAPVGDVVQLQSINGFEQVGWFDERFRAIGGPEADYALRMRQAYPDRLSIHDDHVWWWRHNDVGLDYYWRAQPRVGEIAATRHEFNEAFADVECFDRWMQKWGVHVDLQMKDPISATRSLGWEEIDWYPAFTRRLRELGRL